MIRFLEKRASHVIAENFRVNEAAKVLKEGELIEFGQLMFASHQSLKDLYEVSGIELDTIIEFCKTYNDCIGARMTGAGFGGCAIALIKKEKLEDFEKKLTEYYKNKIGYEPSVFASEIGDGVREIFEFFNFDFLFLMHPVSPNSQLLHDSCFILQPFFPSLANFSFVDIGFSQFDE